jgi:hypothetical protein
MIIPFAAGQVWRYESRVEEPNATVTICRIETLGDKSVVHVSLNNLQLKNPQTATGFQDSLPHLPMDEAVLRECVTELIEENAPLPDYEQGYTQWKEAQGGVWTLPLAEIVDAIESTIPAPKPRKRFFWQ